MLNIVSVLAGLFSIIFWFPTRTYLWFPIKIGSSFFSISITNRIFCLTPLYGAVTENVSLTATEYSVSSFSFDISPLSSRKNVYPEAASFDTTGRIATTTPVPTYIHDFVPWDNGYPINAWSRVINNKAQTTARNNYIQAWQFPHDYSSISLRNKFLVCGMTIKPAKIVYGIVDSANNIVDSYSGNVCDACSSKAFTIVICSTKAYCFWAHREDDETPLLKMSSFSSSNWSGATIINDSSFTDTWGGTGWNCSEQQQS